MLLLLAWILLTLSSVNAEYKIYTSQSEFEKDKGAICEAATDGCNKYIMNDWKVIWGTKMFCANHTPEWNCTKYKEGSVMTLSMPITTTNVEVITTNAKEISDNDKRLYDAILDRLDAKYVNLVDKSIEKIDFKFSKYDSKRKAIIVDRLIEKIEDYLYDLTKSIPQDSKMTEKQTIKYYILNLLKFKLEYWL